MAKSSGGNKKEESPIEMLVRAYPKKFSRLGVPIYKQFDQKMRVCLDDGGPLTQLHLWEESDPNAIRVVFESLKQININTIRSLRLWKIQCGDEGIRSLCEYLTVNNELTVLDLLDNNISSIGCRFLGDCFQNNIATLQIKKLMLDHNLIGNEGLNLLVSGLRRSPFIIELSLSYCGLTEESANSIQQMIMFLKTNLEILNLQGNTLGKNGAFQIFRALEANSKMKEINMADNQIPDDKILIDQLVSVIENNQVIFSINMNFNGIMQEAAERILLSIKKKMRPKIELTDRFSQEFVSEYNGVLMKIKPPKDVKKKKKEGTK